MVHLKQKCKLFFRDVPTTLLLILGFTLAFVIVVNGVALMNTISREQEKSLQDTYENEKKLFLYLNTPAKFENDNKKIYADKLHKFINEFNIETGNLMFINYTVFMGDSMAGVYAEVICSQNEDLRERLVSGRLPTEEEFASKENVVLLSRESEKHTIQKDGVTQVRLGDTYYKVTGFFETNDITSERADVIFFKNAFSEEKMKEFVNDVLEWGYIGVCYGGENIENSQKLIESKIREYGYGIDEDAMKNGNKEYNKKAKLNQIFLAVLLVFCLINCMVISNVWIQRRFRELLIRHTMGYSMTQIAGMLMFDLGKYCALSCIFAVILQSMFSMMFSGNMILREYLLKNTVFILISMAFVVMVTLAIPLVRIKKTVPSRKING